MKLAKWAAVGAGLLVVFALGLWVGNSRLLAPQPGSQVSIAPQSSTVPPAGANAGVIGQPPAIGQATPTPVVSELSQVPLPPARSFEVEPEAAAVKGDPGAPVTIIEYSDYQ